MFHQKSCKKSDRIHRKIEDWFPEFKKPCYLKKEQHCGVENRVKI